MKAGLAAHGLAMVSPSLPENGSKSGFRWKPLPAIATPSCPRPSVGA